MSIRRIKAISYKEFIHLFRDIRSLMVIILVPVILLILFGYALKLDVENVSMFLIFLTVKKAENILQILMQPVHLM